jgi:hypothetical protein
VNNQVRFVSAFNSSLNATETLASVVFPVAGTLSNFDVRLDGAVGNAATRMYTFNIRINGVDVSMPTCQIIGTTATTCSDAVTSVTVNAGDLVSVRVVPSGTPTARAMRWTARFSAAP